MQSSLPDLLDKISYNKKSFHDIVVQIIETFFERDLNLSNMQYNQHASQGLHTKYVIAELLKRFKDAKNAKITEF